MKIAREALLLAAALLVAAGTARLGFWQLDRAAQKIALQSARESRAALPPLAPTDLAREASQVESQVHRRAQVQGRWRAAATRYLENRQMSGRPGFYVVTPLELEAGGTLVVQRGWLPRDVAERTRLAPHATSEGLVVVEGRLAPELSRLYELGDPDPAADAAGPIRHNLPLADYAADIGTPVLPLVLVQDVPSNSDGLERRWPAPASDVSKHHGYAFQWFALSALTAALYVWFRILQPRRRV